MIILSVEAVYPRRIGRKLAALSDVDNLDLGAVASQLTECVQANGPPRTFKLRLHSDDPDAGPFFETYREVELPKKTNRGRRGVTGRVWTGKPTRKDSRTSGIAIPLQDGTLHRITVDPEGVISQDTVLASA